MSDRAIITAIQKAAGTYQEDKVKMLIGTVDSIQGNTCTCIVNDQSIIPGISLQASVCDGLFITPSIGSTVLILYTVQINPFIALYSDIDKYYLQVGNSSIEMLNDGSVTLNDGSFNGLIKGGALTEKLNNLENKVNELISNFNAHTHEVVSVGSPTSAPLSPITGNLTPTIESDIENDKITHGK